MRVLVRVDADAAIGGGHAVRCLALAAALEERGHAVAFRTNPGAGRVVPALAATRSDQGRAADVVVLDRYAAGWAEERALRAETGARLVVAIDDLADRVHDADLLVDSARPREDYRGLLPGAAAVLCGPAYALLRPDFAHRREASMARRAGAAAIRRVVVAFGLSDATPRIAAALDAARDVLPGAAINVVVGPAGAAGAGALVGAATVHVAPAHYPDILVDADLAIGAAGVSALERCVLGLPSVVVPIAENQEASAASLAAVGAAVVVGDGGLRAALLGLAERPSELRDLSRRAAAHCDGRGASRVAEAIERLAATPPAQAPAGALAIRPAGEGDARPLWVWRNDAGTRALSRNQGSIAWQDHRTWFGARLGDTDTSLFVATLGAEPVGSVRFDRKGREADISLVVSPLVRGHGIGAALLDAGCRRLEEQGFDGTFLAVVARDNAPSLRLFAKAGFQPAGGAEWLALRRAARG